MDRSCTTKKFKTPSIPNEIYLEILTFLKPRGWITPKRRKDLISLALVCRLFYSVVLPWCFDSFVIPHSGDQAHKKLFWRMFRKKPPALSLAKHVRRCAISDPDIAFCLNPTTLSFLSAAPLMAQLCELNIEMNVSRNTHSILAALNNLETITIKTSLLAATSEDTFLTTTHSPIRATNAIMLNHFAQGFDLQMFSVDHLRRLSFANGSTDWFPYIAKFLSLEQLAIMGEFDWTSDGGSGQSLTSTLNKLSSLKTLRIATRSVQPEQEQDVQDGRLHNLEELEGPWALCNNLLQIQGVRRRLTILRILNSPKDGDQLPSLETLIGILGRMSTEASLKLHGLQLPMQYATQEFLGALAEALPVLCSLGFEIPPGVISHPDKESYLSAIRPLLLAVHHPNVHTLSFAFWATSSFIDKRYPGLAVYGGLAEIFDSLDIEKCPSLRQVDLIDIETRRPYLSYALIDGDWLQLERECFDAFESLEF